MIYNRSLHVVNSYNNVATFISTGIYLNLLIVCKHYRDGGIDVYLTTILIERQRQNKKK